ncbi:MAG TPA: hypothetical protein VMZ92_10960 [Planctomycetota bacterium]|nr:hypothetical protein [Planctomycetota bacterium]
MKHAAFILAVVVLVGGCGGQKSAPSGAEGEPETAASQVHADLVVTTDRKVHPEPEPPELPKAGETFVDPTFGTTLMRVTDERDGENGQVAYSYWPTFNRTSTRFHLLCDKKALVYTFDPDAFKITGKEELFATRPPDRRRPSWEDSIWSGTDPDVVFGRAALKLWSYNVKDQSYTLVNDFVEDLPPEPKLSTLWQMSKSEDDRTFCFTIKGRHPEYRSYGCIVWRRDDDKIVLNWKARGKFDEAHLDKTGQYVHIIDGERPIGSYVVGLRTGKVDGLTKNAPDYGPGHSGYGRGTLIGYENWKNRILLRKFSDPHHFLTLLDHKEDWSQDRHISMLANDETWALVSLYVGNKLPSSGLFRNEIIQVATDGSRRVRRLCHHHAISRNYWDTPRANISRDGRFVAFTSNWGGRDQRDVFILKVPKPAKGIPAGQSTEHAP